jgi:phosphoglucomutase
LIAGLLAAEITARMQRDPGEIYTQLTQRFGNPVYQRMDAPANREQKAILSKLSADSIKSAELAGEPVIQVMTSAPGDGNAIGGVKVVAKDGWFAARPSGTEDIYKIYAESFKGEDHLKRIQEEAQVIVGRALAAV